MRVSVAFAVALEDRVLAPHGGTGHGRGQLDGAVLIGESVQGEVVLVGPLVEDRSVCLGTYLDKKVQPAIGVPLRVQVTAVLGDSWLELVGC